MTIKEFAGLCDCNAQTLRYYDKIDLLKPARVDPWSGYRYYDPVQAIDFVKIKNLQTADFSIQEIKDLLTKPDQQVYVAFEEKIAAQTQKLKRIREIQQSYLAEKNTMEQIVYSMTDYLLSQCDHPEVLTEFGLTPEAAPAILACLKQYMNNQQRRTVPSEQITMTINDEVIRGQEAVLNRVRSLTKENLTDTILLHDGFGHHAEETADPEPDFGTMEVVWERQDWAHAYEFIDSIPPLEPGRGYCLWIKTKDAYADDLSFPLFLIGVVLRKQQAPGIVVNCASTTAEDRKNHFKLLCKKETV